MAEIYDSEQEQLEALQRWWKEHAKTVIAGLVIGLGGVFGWTSWTEYKRGQSEAASALFQEQTTALRSQEFTDADQLGTRLLVEFPSSGYATMAAMLLGKSAYEQNKPDDARRHLQWVLDNSKQADIAQIAQLRLARLSFDANDLDGALALLQTPASGQLKAIAQELKGDIWVAKGDKERARESYASAIAGLEAAGGSVQARVQAKLDDLGHVNVATN